MRAESLGVSRLAGGFRVSELWDLFSIPVPYHPGPATPPPRFHVETYTTQRKNRLKFLFTIILLHHPSYSYAQYIARHSPSETPAYKTVRLHVPRHPRTQTLSGPLALNLLFAGIEADHGEAPRSQHCDVRKCLFRFRVFRVWGLGLWLYVMVLMGSHRDCERASVES